MNREMIGNREMIAICLTMARICARNARLTGAYGSDWAQKARYWIFAAREWRTS